MKFEDPEDLDQWWSNVGEPWFAVQDSIEDIYIIYCTEDGDAIYQGIPFLPDESEPQAVDPNRGRLEHFPGQYPLYLLMRREET